MKILERLSVPTGDILVVQGEEGKLDDQQEDSDG